ncbi:hypothetical protein C8R44DRAFT_598615, partial [Mycena epipterygia]
WPGVFHAAFFAQVWCTYREGFEPIRDLPGLGTLPSPWYEVVAVARGAGRDEGWTSDAGWGCMLRTGPSLLAAGLGRVGDPSFTTYPPPARTRLLSLFLDALVAPFGVYRMALAGKAAGKDVGMWFGLSAAKGAIR